MTHLVELPFSAQEYRDRVSRFREKMRAGNVDVALVTGPENQYYLTGLRTGTVQYFMTLVVPVDGEGLWVVRRTELSNVESLKTVSWVKHGVGVTDGESSVQVLADTLREQGFEQSRIGVDRRSYFFHTEFQLGLEQELSKATLVDASGWVEAGRAVKSDAELSELRTAGVITATALSRGIDSLVEGITDRQIGATLTSSAIEAGSESMSAGPYVTVGERTFMAHSSWVGQSIGRGDIVNTEMAARVNGYNAPCFRVSVIGQPSQSLQRFHAASEQGLHAGLEGIRGGMTSEAADRVVRDAIDATGLGEYFVVRAAYGIGLGFAPAWSEDHVMSIRPGDQRVLLPGMCFHLVPALYKAGFGAVCCSMPVVVTESGLEPLLDHKPRLYVVS